MRIQTGSSLPTLIGQPMTGGSATATDLARFSGDRANLSGSTGPGRALPFLAALRSTFSVDATPAANSHDNAGSPSVKSADAAPGSVMAADGGVPFQSSLGELSQVATGGSAVGESALSTSPQLELDRSDPSGSVARVNQELRAQQQARVVADERVAQATSGASSLEHSQRRLLNQHRGAEDLKVSGELVLPDLQKGLEGDRALLRANDQGLKRTRGAAEDLRSRIERGHQATDSRGRAAEQGDRDLRFMGAAPGSRAALRARREVQAARDSLGIEQDQAKLRAYQDKLESDASIRRANARQADRRRTAMQRSRDRLKDLTARRGQLGSQLAEVVGSREGVEKSRQANNANSRAARANESNLQELANRLPERTGRRGALGEPDPVWKREVGRDELPDGSAGARQEPGSVRSLAGTAGVRDHGERISVRLERLTQGLSALYGDGKHGASRHQSFVGGAGQGPGVAVGNANATAGVDRGEGEAAQGGGPAASSSGGSAPPKAAPSPEKKALPVDAPGRPAPGSTNA